MPGKSFAPLVFITTVLIMGQNLKGLAQNGRHLRFVNSFIGTAKSNVLTKWGNEGGTYPGAVAPSGALQLSPETKPNGSYDYTDSTVYYFSCFRHLSGFPGGSAGQFFIMPLNADINLETGNYSRRFSHKDEIAYPGYYKVAFDDDHSVAEATATKRAGMFRFTFNSGETYRLFIGNAGEISLITKRILHFTLANTVVNFSEDYNSIKKVSGGWVVSFNNDFKRVINLKISTSTVGYTGAQSNIDLEIGNASFEQVCKQTQDDWEKKLSVIDIKDDSKENKTIFYTALYHSLLLPWVIDDVDGKYTGVNGKVYKRSGQNQYGGFSPWDTFRSLNPMLALLYPGKENDIILSMLDIYKQTGHLPIESMTGNHSIPIIVDGYFKGISNYNKTLAYQAMKSNILEPPYLQKDMEVYHRKGYVPFTNAESVTRTVEYAYDDWALAQYAGKAMKDDATYKVLARRGYNYRNLLNPEMLFLLPRNNDEFKLMPGMSGYKEGDQWVYSYFTPQNTKDLINLLGGNDQFSERLDSALTNNVILFDNETVFHLPYLFDVAGKPALTQKWCRRIMNDRFSNTPGGLPGNDDLGSTSSWYVFSAMGIYPVCPGRSLYIIGSPLFKSLILHLPNGKKFTFNAGNSSKKMNYIQSLSLNGQLLQQLTISHATLINGGTMTFNMGAKSGKWPAGKNPVQLSETKAASLFKISDCSASVKEVKPDQPFFFNFSITNKGSLGVKTVKLMVNGKLFSHKNCLVAPMQTLKDSIECRLYPIGKSLLNIEGTAPIAVSVIDTKKGSDHLYKITGLMVKPIVKLGGRQSICFTVQNVGGSKRVFNIPVLCNDSIIFTDTVRLEPGEKKVIKHDLLAEKTGFQHVSVEDVKAGYKVYQNNLESLLLDLPLKENVKGNLFVDKSGFDNNARIMPVDAGHTTNSAGNLLFGENCFLEIPDKSSLNINGETITMIAWIYPVQKENGLVDIFTQGDTNVLQVSNSTTLTFFAGGWGRGDCTVNLPKNWQQHWHQIAGVCSGKVLYVYIDGILTGTTIVNDSSNLSVNNRWTLGRNEEFPSERIYHGYLRNVKIFKEALSGDEILSIFNSEKGDFSGN